MILCVDGECDVCVCVVMMMVVEVCDEGIVWVFGGVCESVRGDGCVDVGCDGMW